MKNKFIDSMIYKNHIKSKPNNQRAKEHEEKETLKLYSYKRTLKMRNKLEFNKKFRNYIRNQINYKVSEHGEREPQ